MNGLKESVSQFLLEKSEKELENIAHNMNTLISYYRCALLEIETKFRVLDEQFSYTHERNPIESIKTRIKTMDSIFGKLRRKGIEMSIEAIEKNINDIAGIRVICSYIDDVYMLAKSIVRQDDVKLLKIKDYIRSPKPNGYRSLHLILEVPIFLHNEKRYIRVEVQLRTIAMETWANLEHNLRYKKGLDDEILDKISGELNKCAELSHALDIRMQEVKNIVENYEDDDEDDEVYYN